MRAAAALKRLETEKAESRKLEDEEDDDESTGDDTDYDDDVDWNKAVDVGDGRYLIPVSEKEDGDREYDFLRGELLDLADACGRGVGREKNEESRFGGLPVSGEPSSDGDLSIISETRVAAPTPTTHRRSSVDYEERGPSRVQGTQALELAPVPVTSKEAHPGPKTHDPPLSREHHISTTSTGNEPGGHLECTACSFANNHDAVLCLTCANVLEPRKMKSAWRCSCYGDLRYLNAGDAGVCGICGQRKKPVS